MGFAVGPFCIGVSMGADAVNCYLLEFSVGGGGSRIGDVHAVPDLGAARESFEGHWGDSLDDVLAYHVMWYGAVLHLWVVRQGAITEGFDLRPCLRSGDAACDRTLARIISLQERAPDDERAEEIWDDADSVMDGAAFDCAPTLPLLGRVLELHDRIDAAPGSPAAVRAEKELEEFRDADHEPLEGWPADDAGPRSLRLDWDALAAVTPSLEKPFVSSDWMELRWADEPIHVKDSHVTYGLQWYGRLAVHSGWNDLENGESET